MRRGLAYFYLAFLSLVANADVYIRDGDSGSGTSWSDALDSIPATLTRGETYWLGDGSYGAVTLDDAASGTTTITLKKAKESDHGTETGWDSAYGDGQAVFTSLTLETDYWVVDGNTDTRLSYGIHVDSSSTVRAVTLGTYSGDPASNCTLKDITIDLADAPTTEPSGRGIYMVGVSNNTFTNIEVHSALNDCIFFDGADDVIFEHMYLRNRRTVTSGDTIHADAAEMYDGNNVTFRYCLFDWEGQQLFFSEVSNPHGTFEIYGNVFYGGPTSGKGMHVQSTGVTDFTHNIVNNTFYGLNASTSNLRLGTMYNNIFWDSGDPAFGSTTHDYNFFQTGIATGGEANAQQTASDPFTDGANDDFTLSGATDGGKDDVGATYNTDPEGATRGDDGTWDRGAFEFEAGGGGGGSPSGSTLTTETLNVGP